MPCFSPLTGYRSKDILPSGKRRIVFNRNASLTGEPIPLPCGQCIGCRLRRSREWAIRCMHEKASHKNAEFLTLTYNEDNLPSDYSLSVDHFQRFLKRLRKNYGRFKYYYCGEYGPRTGRPHYHALIYGLTFPDKVYHKSNDRGEPLYTSARLDKTWSYGHCVLGDVTFESAAYVASYVVDKITGPRAAEHYVYVDPDGRIHARLPEYSDMSNGIGKAFFAANQEHLYYHDNTVINGAPVPLPRYYDILREAIDPDGLNRLKLNRRARAQELLDHEKSLETKWGIPRRHVNHYIALERLTKKGTDL